MAAAETLHDEVGIANVADSHREIEALRDDVDGAIREVEVDRDLRVPMEEILDEGTKDAYADVDPDRDTQEPSWLARVVRDVGDGVIDARDDAGAAVVQEGPRLRQADVLGLSLEQARSDPGKFVEQWGGIADQMDDVVQQLTYEEGD